MPKIVVDPKIIKLVEDSINSGKSIRNIRKNFPELPVSDKVIHRIARDLGINDTLKINSDNDRGMWLTERANISAADRTRTLATKYFDIINNLARNDGMISTIHRALNEYEPISKSTTINILEYLGLRNTCKLNFTRWQSQHQLVRSKKGAAATRGSEIIRHPVTDEMRVFYKELIQAAEYNGIGRKKFHNKFGTSKKVWETLAVEFGKLPNHPSKFLSGADNLMYGKSPSYKAGIGCKGWLVMKGKRILFRSTLELIVYLQLIKNNIQFNISKHRIQYNNNTKTYCPDIVIGDTIYEIKPSNLISMPINVAKMRALQTYCDKYKLKCGYITESTYQVKINYESILDLIEKNSILLTSDKTKFLNTLNHYSDAIDKN